MQTLFKNGFIVDGSGEEGFNGDVLIENNKIKTVSDADISVGRDAQVIDCHGLVVSPGFIDVHSHNEYLIWLKNKEDLIKPFICQGVTSFVGGHCGYSPGGFKKGTPYMKILKEEACTMYNPQEEFAFTSMDEFLGYIKTSGVPANIASFIGHGTVRTSMKGSGDAPLNPDEMKELLGLLGKGMDEGCAGVSFGLQYAPGICTPIDEIEEIARLIKKKDKVFSVHLKAYTMASTVYDVDPFENPHNLIAVKEMLDIGRKTGVKLMLSHMVFPGPATWPTAPKFLELIDQAIADGVDVKFDIIGETTSYTYTTVMFPEWAMAKMPDVLNDKEAIENLKKELDEFFEATGFTPKDFIVLNTMAPELKKYIGSFYHDMAIDRGLSQTDNIIDIVKQEYKNGGSLPGILFDNNSSEEVLELLCKHPACLCASDAQSLSGNIQNKATYGNFPRCLQRARETQIPLEEIVRKMTGASAQLVGLKDRGFLKEGYAADITVFNWETVKDNASFENTTAAPTGIEQVFINGANVFKDGSYVSSDRTGDVILLD